MSEGFNSSSTDSMFAQILERLKQQDARAEEDRAETKNFRRELEAKLQGHDGRISSLESDRNKAYGVAAGAGGLMGWISGIFK